jgi:hypothetical protein
MSFNEPAFPDDDGMGDMSDPGAPIEGDAEKKMTAQSQGADPSFDPEADDEMGLTDEEDPEAGEDQADLENTIDVKLGNADDAEFDDTASTDLEDDGTVGLPGEDDPVDAPDLGFDDEDPDFAPENEETARLHPEELRMMRGGRNVTESVAMPKKPAGDAKPTENKTTANNMKATPVIDYKDPANKADRPDTDLTKSGAEAHEDTVKIPASIKSALKSVIAEFDKTAKFANTRDDTKAAFCMTVVEAFKELLDLLELGTVESMKLAQIHMASLMNPISSHLPPEVVKFVLMAGRKPTLKDLFDSKRDTRKEA